MLCGVSISELGNSGARAAEKLPMGHHCREHMQIVQVAHAAIRPPNATMCSVWAA